MGFPRRWSRWLVCGALLATVASCGRRVHVPSSNAAGSSEPQALVGFSPIFRADERRMAELALRTPGDAAIQPIPLDVDPGGPRHGTFYTPFLLASLAVRDARAHSRPIESHPFGGGGADLPTVVVAAAFPLACDGSVSPPEDIRVIGSSPGVSPANRAAARLQPPTRRGAEIAKLLPGETLPPGSLVGAFRSGTLGDLSVEIDYGEPSCSGISRTLIFPLTRPRPTLPSPVSVLAKFPASSARLPSPTTTQVMGVIDSDGRVAFPGLSAGPIELAAVAEDAVRELHGEPDRLNGVAQPAMLSRPVIFTATGEPPERIVPTPAEREATVAAALARVARYAIEMAKQGPVQPWPLDADGATIHGFAYDDNMLAQLAVRRLMASGETVDAGALPPNFAPNGVLIVALPLVCGARRVLPTGIEIALGQSAIGPARTLSGPQLKSEFPDVDAPDDAIAVFHTPLPLERAAIKITYAEPACPVASATVSLAMQSTPAQPPSASLTLPFPDGVDDLPSPTRVGVDAIIDAEGRAHLVEIIGSPRPDLAAAAEHAVATARWTPKRVNGVAAWTATALSVAFTATGRTLSSSPSSLTGMTMNAHGLTRETSLCVIADDAAYGTMANPIAVGGDDWHGVAHERAFLNALRGPTGQGIAFRWIGSQLSATSQTFRDVYELTYDELATPRRLVLDEYHVGPLQAPTGFTCALPLDAR